MKISNKTQVKKTYRVKSIVHRIENNQIY